MANPQAALRRKAGHDPATPRGPRGLSASVKLDRGPEYGAGRESTPLRRHFRPQSWPGAAGPPLPGPRPTGTEEGEGRPSAPPGRHCRVLPAWGPGTFTPSAQGQLLPALSFYPPQPAPGPETRVAPHTRDELHANLSATPAGGLVITQTAPLPGRHVLTSCRSSAPACTPAPGESVWASKSFHAQCPLSLPWALVGEAAKPTQRASRQLYLASPGAGTVTPAP